MAVPQRVAWACPLAITFAWLIACVRRPQLGYSRAAAFSAPFAGGHGPGMNTGGLLLKLVGEAIQKKCGDEDITLGQVQQDALLHTHTHTHTGSHARLCAGPYVSCVLLYLALFDTCSNGPLPLRRSDASSLPLPQVHLLSFCEL
eukprot:2126807-Pleurochrysis_carterae.AAC.1